MRFSGWVAAIFVAFGVHVAGFAWYARQAPSRPPISKGEGGVVLQLAEIGGPAGSELPQATESEAEPLDEIMEEQVQPEPIAEPEPEPEPEPIVELEPEPAIEPEPEPEPEPTPVPAVETVAGDDLPEGGAPGSVASVASDTPSDTGGDPEAVLAYAQEMQLWLQRYKRYPRRLKRRRIEGEVVVAFTIDAEGRLLESRVVRSSGEPGLDQAAMDLLADAEPMPPIPPEMGVDRYATELPVRYGLD